MAKDAARSSACHARFTSLCARPDQLRKDRPESQYFGKQTNRHDEHYVERNSGGVQSHIRYLSASPGANRRDDGACSKSRCREDRSTATCRSMSCISVAAPRVRLAVSFAPNVSNRHSLLNFGTGEIRCLSMFVNHFSTRSVSIFT